MGEWLIADVSILNIQVWMLAVLDIFLFWFVYAWRQRR
jgi:hypothetical protein